jgi:16S rRNA (adenine1518-N6/adenine1519-N6)-dimethyltransferase
MRQPKGQNFLIDKEIAHKIVAAAQISADDNVIEIGPGRGVLTDYIARQAKTLTIVEIDEKLASNLTIKYANHANVTVIHADFFKFDVPASLGKVKFIANLPYYAATKMIEKVIPYTNWEKAVFMVQKEVGERIVSQKDRKTYGFLSVFCQYYVDCKILLKCPPSVFFPKPKVDSVVLALSNKYPPVPDVSLFKFVKHAFAQKRKTILNSLTNSIGCEKPLVAELLQKAGIDPSLRPENLSLESFINLTLNAKKCNII